MERATFVNIAVDLFEHGTNKSVPLDYDPAVLRADGRDPLLLYAAKENDPMLIPSPQVAPGASSAEKMTYTANGQTFPRWVFNNIPVEPGRQYHFAALLTSIRVAHPSIWTHGPDARTCLPVPEPPRGCSSSDRVIARPSPPPMAPPDPNAPPTLAAHPQN